MRALLVVLLVVLLFMSVASFGQDVDRQEVKDDIGALGAFAWIVATPIDLIGTPLYNLWCEFWTMPARGADLVEYQDKYYYDYGTGTYRETDDRTPAGRRPLGEFKAPNRRPRETKHIIYLPPKR